MREGGGGREEGGGWCAKEDKEGSREEGVEWFFWQFVEGRGEGFFESCSRKAAE